MTTGLRIYAIGSSMALSLLLVQPLAAQSDEPSDSPRLSLATQTSADRSPGGISLPDVVLFDQNGRQVHFYRELVKDKVVAINFIFTTCTAICPRMGANFSALQKLVSDRAGRSFSLISISIDPVTDTPERLKAWSIQFNAGPGWTLLTGPKQEVETLLKALGVFANNKDTHSAIVLLGNDASGEWLRTSGLAAPAKLADLISVLSSDAPISSGLQPVDDDQLSEEQRDPRQRPPGEFSAAHRSFPDVALINQNGEKVQFYSDLLKDKVVVMNPFSASCQRSCPRITPTLAKIQNRLGDRLGKEVCLISISINPEKDTPVQLKSFAEQVAAKPGWYFLTGDKDIIHLAVSRIGLYAEEKEERLNSLIIGNDHTGLWIKTFGLTKAEHLLKLIECVLNDREVLLSKIRF